MIHGRHAHIWVGTIVLTPATSRSDAEHWVDYLAGATGIPRDVFRVRLCRGRRGRYIAPPCADVDLEAEYDRQRELETRELDEEILERDRQDRI